MCPLAECMMLAALLAPAPGPTPAPKCVEALDVRADSSVLMEQRRKGAPWPDFPGRYASAAIDPAKYSPVDAVKSHQVRGRPMLWFTPDESEAVVDRDVLSAVTIADVTRLDEGDPAVTVTRVAGTARGEHAPRTWLRFLIASGAIQTFAHAEAALCVESEREREDGYEACVSGRHV
jgi:hypothetical protein